MSEPEVIDGELVDTETGEVLPAVAANSPNRELAQWQPSTIASMSEDEFRERMKLATLERQRLKEVQLSVMQAGEDYGTIPGTNKATLLKPGAETLNKMAGLVPEFDVRETRGDGISGPHIHYVVVCTLHVGELAGPAKASGVGSANSWETKYRYRKLSRKCPDCGKESIITGRKEYGGGFVCWKKHPEQPGCGAKFKDNDERITSQPEGKVDNPDPYDLANTLIKMAKKRAFVDATLTEHAASGLFTQDIGDAREEQDKRQEQIDRQPDDPNWRVEKAADELVKEIEASKRRIVEKPPTSWLDHRVPIFESMSAAHKKVLKDKTWRWMTEGPLEGMREEILRWIIALEIPSDLAANVRKRIEAEQHRAFSCLEEMQAAQAQRPGSSSEEVPRQTEVASSGSGSLATLETYARSRANDLGLEDHRVILDEALGYFNVSKVDPTEDEVAERFVKIRTFISNWSPM